MPWRSARRGEWPTDAALLEPAQAEFRDFESTRGYVRLSAELARSYLLLARDDEAMRVVDATLPARGAPRACPRDHRAARHAGAALAAGGRPREATITLIGAVSAASAADMPDVELRGRVNLSYAAAGDDPQLAYRTAREGLELAHKFGMRGYAYYMIGNAGLLAMRVGDWEWAIAEAEEAAAGTDLDHAARWRLAEIRGLQGHDVDAELQELAGLVADMTELQAQSAVAEIRAQVAYARGDFRHALDLAQTGYRTTMAPDGTAPQIAIRAAAGLHDADAVRDALRAAEGIPGRVTAAIRREGEATLAGLAGRRQESLAGFLDAVHRWQELGLAVEAALAQLNLVTVLGVTDPEARAAGDAASTLFRRLGAQPWLDRLGAAVSGGAVPGGTTDAPAGAAVDTGVGVSSSRSD